MEVRFQIELHRKDEELLKLIQAYFGGVGAIYPVGKGCSAFRASTVDHILKIMDHFDKYPLITQKLADYLQFRDAVNLMINKEHLTNKGLNKIVSIKAVINLGLPAELQFYFPDIIPTLRPLVKNKTAPHDQ